MIVISRIFFLNSCIFLLFKKKTESRVDGDLLLQLSEDMLREDIGMRNGILRRRFMRELTRYKFRYNFRFR